MATSVSELTYLRDLVRERSAIVIESNKDYLIETRLAPLAREAGFDSIGALVNGMRGRSATHLECKVVEAMTTNETLFFRDMQPFEALKRAVLPELIRNRKKKTLSIWSAACSTGQEPYSIAMLLDDAFPELRSWKIQIFATDLSSGVLSYAREGRYRQLEMNRGLPAAMLVRYFERDGIDWRVKPELRARVEFSQLNLIERWPALPTFDVVFIRNVLIYFDVATKRSILERVGKQMSRDGYLFLGGAETTMNITNAFERTQFERSSYYRLTDKEGGK